MNEIAPRMRWHDRRECAAFGQPPRAALLAGLRYSSQCWTALADDRAEAMFGLVVESALGGTGTPWMLGTDVIHAHGRTLIRDGRRFVAKLLDTSPRLANLVSAENERAIRLLRAWGFSVDGEQEMIGDLAFRRFEQVR